MMEIQQCPYQKSYTTLLGVYRYMGLMNFPSKDYFATNSNLPTRAKLASSRSYWFSKYFEAFIYINIILLDRNEIA